MPKTEDRRVRYTKMVLKESLLKLLRQKPVSHITVKELCELADVNRATFYAHYDDPQALLCAIEDELVVGICEMLDIRHFDGRNASTDLFERVFEYLEQNKEACAVLLADNGDVAFQRNVAQIVRQRCIEAAQVHREATWQEEYIYAYGSTGCVGLIRRWLAEGTPQSPRELAEFVCALVMNGMNAFEGMRGLFVDPPKKNETGKGKENV